MQFFSDGDVNNVTVPNRDTIRVKTDFIIQAELPIAQTDTFITSGSGMFTRCLPHPG